MQNHRYLQLYIWGHNSKGKNRKFTRLHIKHLKNAKEKQWKNNIDCCYFDILSKNGAYILGLLLADGCLSGGIRENGEKFKVISLGLIDFEIINKIKKELKMKIRVQICKNKKGRSIQKHTVKKTKNIYRISIHNKKLIKRLKQLCMIKRKTRRLHISKEITDDLFFPFLRGFFDGDGWFCYNKKYNTAHFGICSCSRKFLIVLKNRLSDFNIYSRIRNLKCSKLVIDRKNDLKLLYKFLYKDANDLFISRKEKKFRNFIENWKPMVINGKQTPELIEKRSFAMKLACQRPEVKLNKSLGATGRKFSPALREKISLGNKRWFIEYPEEAKTRLKNLSARMILNNPMKKK